jgi:hypothetical protein
MAAPGDEYYRCQHPTDILIVDAVALADPAQVVVIIEQEEWLVVV